jgi:hypothetical protein
MSRMGEWFMEWHEDDDLDLMLAELHHQEELEQQRREEEDSRRYPVVLTPIRINDEPADHAAVDLPGVLHLRSLR